MLNKIDPDQLDEIIGLVQKYYLFAVLALAVIIAVVAVLLYFFARDAFKKFTTFAAGIVLGVSLCIIFTLMSLTLARYVIKGRITYTFWLTIGLMACAFVFAIVAYVLNACKVKAFKPFAIAAAAFLIVYSIVLVIFVPAKEEYYKPSSSALYYGLSAALIAVMAVLAFTSKSKFVHTTKSITYAAACLATSFALSYVKFFELPQGGSVTLASVLPIMLYSYIFGAKNGLICGLLYGMLQFMQSPVLYQPMQFFLDYPLAFGCIGLCGFLKGRINDIAPLEFAIGAVVSGVLRFASHVISGVFVFYTYAGDANPWIYSLTYNSFVFVDIAIVIAVGIALLLSKSFRKVIENAASENNNVAEESKAD